MEELELIHVSKSGSFFGEMHDLLPVGHHIIRIIVTICIPKIIKQSCPVGTNIHIV